MDKKFKELKEEILNFIGSIRGEDPREWTPEKFSKINAVLTVIEENIMEMEKECNGLILDINELKKIFAGIRKIYFEKPKEE